ncbi:hypothetical protein HanRHA438_Chr07g0323721 [Helianthus annuus]|nr:hypothetical protein HanRHA438_Chr07g0323721 [Helianthus annuus]
MISVILLRRHHLRLPLPVTGRPDAAGIVTATHRLTQLPFLLFVSQVCQSYFGGFDSGIDGDDGGGGGAGVGGGGGVEVGGGGGGGGRGGGVWREKRRR